MDRLNEGLIEKVADIRRELDALKSREQAANFWLPVGAVATYVSATSFTLVGDFTAYFKIGTKFRCTNSTTKYGYILSSSYAAPNTTVNLATNTSYSLASAAITDVKISYASPPDFPAYLNYTPAWTASVTNPVLGNGTISGIFSITNRILVARVVLTMGSTTTFGSGIYYFSSPTPLAQFFPGFVLALDSGTAQRVGATFPQDTTKVRIQSDGIMSAWSNTVPHTWAVNDNIYLRIDSTI